MSVYNEKKGKTLWTCTVFPTQFRLSVISYVMCMTT